MLNRTCTFARSDQNRFFHENVGASAWGLAIHEKSRLIAASSNLRQVTVFMAAYTSPDETPAETSLAATLYPEVAQLPGSPADRTWSGKRVLKLGEVGHNVPSLSFADDHRGEAHSILAVDITGNLWMFDLYGDEYQRLSNIDPGEPM